MAGCFELALSVLRLALRFQDLVLRFLKLVGNGWILNFQNLVLRLAGLIAGLRKLVSGIPRLILRFQNLAFGGKPVVCGLPPVGFACLELYFEIPEVVFRLRAPGSELPGPVFALPEFGPERRVAGFCVSRAWSGPRGFAAGLPAIAAGLLRPDSVLPGRVSGFGKVKKVAFLFTPPYPLTDCEQQGDQLEFWPSPDQLRRLRCSLARISRYQRHAGRPQKWICRPPGGIQRSIRRYRVTKRGNKTFIFR